MSRGSDAGDEPPGAAEWVSLVLLCGSAMLSALLELVFLGQFYIGKHIVPVVVLAALAGNVLLPIWGFSLVQTARGAVLPVASWLVMLFGLSFWSRPEGDLIVITANGQQGAFYALLLVGAIAGFSSIVFVGRHAPARPGPSGPRLSR